MARRLEHHRRGARVLTGQQPRFRELLEHLEVVLAGVERLAERLGGLGRRARAHHVLGVLHVVEGRFAGESVEQVQLREGIEHLRGRKRQPQHLLADGDRVLEQRRLLVRRDGGQIALGSARLVPLLVEEVREEHEVVGVGLFTADELLVFGERAVQIAVLDAALCPTLDVDRLFQVGWLSPACPSLPAKVCP
ncbi:MAG: hypothetical protein IPJ04_12295 [Candidatus Eisenbacteria bacterium]|nr:hypothetical protein [Candidatus Eisenbacteria bacterium]